MALEGPGSQNSFEMQEIGPAVSLCENKLCKRAVGCGNLKGQGQWKLKLIYSHQKWSGSQSVVRNVEASHYFFPLKTKFQGNRQHNHVPKNRDGFPGGLSVGSKSFQFCPTLCNLMDC